MKEVKIMLDAGHYGKYNRSPAVKAYYESDFTFKFCDMLKEELKAYGIKADTTRANQANDLGLYARGKAAKGYDLFISIHSNATGSGGANETVDYPVAITMVEDSKTIIDEESKVVGEKLAQVVAEVMGTKQKARTYTRKNERDWDGNGIFDDEWYGVLNGAKQVKVAGIILEHSFHTNTRATKWLLNDDNLRKMAKAEAAALAEHYGVSKKADQDTAAEPEKPATWYRVRKTWEDSKSQLGAYREKDNAVKNCPEGYTVFGDGGAVIYINAKEDKKANKLYRVRKSWKDSKSQLGAYKEYDNAERNCPAGYAVYNDNGEEVYRNTADRTHTVKRGDTLGKIAKEYGTNVDKIVKDNKTKYPKITASYIVVGWKLVIK